MSSSRPRVAVVDDDESVRRALSRLLRSASLSVMTYASANEFLSERGHADADCLVLDLHMPEMNGLELQRRLIRDGIRMPVVVVTGHDDDVLREECLACGALALLRKPLSGEALLGAIGRALAPV